ncbi:serine/arginine repetitive matrix protein 2-like [Aquila chrysaetos chrysaetos]|uniref:serine/arginine repetitive matrix protein 2-like n=1 Tax=Aquila chrysaetos chrysaetos TaxID=223781 RepID=UPI001B7D333A|nr:serine/arginine repetitive matrix protein 2-like [Aquila chrysaetos chrysaetos]
MNDSSVDRCDISTVLQQQAYLLFYVRSPDFRGGRPSSPRIASHARAFLRQWAAGSKQVDPAGPWGLLPRTKNTAVGREDSPEDTSSSTRTSTSQLNWADAREASAARPGGRSVASYTSRTQPGFPFCRQLFDLGLHAAQHDDDEEEEDGFSSCSCCQRNVIRERAWSSFPQRDNDFRSWLTVPTDYSLSARRRRSPSREEALRDDSPPWTSNASSRWAPASRAAREQRLLRERTRSRSPRRGYTLRSRFVEYADCRGSARRRRTSPPSHEQTPRDDSPAWTSNTSSKRVPASRDAGEQTQLRERTRSRSPRRGYNLCSRFVEYTDDHRSARGGRRRSVRRSPPRRE